MFAAPEAAAATSALPEQAPSLASVIAEASLSREPTRDAATLPYLEASVGPPPSKTGASSVDAAALLGLFGGPPPSAAPAPLDRGSSTSTSSPPTALCRGSSSSSGVFPPLGRTASTSSVASSSSEQREKKEVPWTQAEDEMLMGGVETNRDDQNRPAWSVISKKLKAAGFDRSAQQARCRYMRMERGRVKREQGKAKNYCKTCGQLRAGHICTGKPPPAPPEAAAAAAEPGRESAVRLDLLAVAAMQNLHGSAPTIDPALLASVLP